MLQRGWSISVGRIRHGTPPPGGEMPKSMEREMPKSMERDLPKSAQCEESVKFETGRALDQSARIFAWRVQGPDLGWQGFVTYVHGKG